MIEGSNWLLKVIFGGCIFLSFSTKIVTFWSLSQRNCKLVQICVFDHILSAKVVFRYIFRSIFSKEIVKFRVGNKNFEKLGKYMTSSSYYIHYLYLLSVYTSLFRCFSSNHVSHFSYIVQFLSLPKFHRLFYSKPMSFSKNLILFFF